MLSTVIDQMQMYQWNRFAAHLIGLSGKGGLSIGAQANGMKIKSLKPIIFVINISSLSLFQRQKIELGYKKLFEKNLLGTTIWSPLAGGVLTGKYNNGIPEGSRYDKNPELVRFLDEYFGAEKKEKTIASLTKFKDLADSIGCSQAQLAMAWCISNPDISTAITGATRPEQLVETVKSIDFISKLTPEVQLKIEEIFNSEPIGKRNMKYFAP